MNSKFKQYKTKYADLFSIICLLFVCTLFLSPYLFSIPTPLIYPVSDLGTDLDREVLPNIEYVVDYYKSTGQIPLWRPYQLSGAPVIGHPTFPIFYPLYWLFLIIPKPIGLNLLALFNIFFLGVGMYMYLRNGGKNKPFPSLIGAIVMAISPKWIAHLSGGHWFMLSALAFTPWAIFALDQFWKTRRITWLLLLSLFLSAQAMNHQPIFAITCILLVLLSALYLSKVNWKSWLILMPWGGMLVSAITFSLSAVTILPLLKLIPHSVKAINTSTFTSLNPAALIVSLIPPEFKYPEWFLYPGLIVIIFSGLSWAYGWTNFEKKWAAVGLLGCVLSLGEFTPIYNGLFGWNLLISVLRVPTRWWLMTLLALTILATSGFSLWLKNNKRLNKKATIFILVMLGVEVIAGLMKGFISIDIPFDVIPTSIIALLFGFFLLLNHYKSRNAFVGLMMIGLVFELFIVGRSLIRPQDANFIDVSDKIVLNIKSRLNSWERIFSPNDGFPPITLIHSGINAAEGYDALPFANYLQFIRLATGCPLVHDTNASEDEKAACLNPDSIDYDLLKLINVRLLVFHHQDKWRIEELSVGLGRVFSIPNVEKTDPYQCFDRLKTSDTLKVALIEEIPLSNVNGQVKIISQQLNIDDEVFQVIVTEAPVLLIRSETWAQGWFALIDGQKKDVIRVDCALQGVWLEPGSHTIEFVYRPFGYPLGAWISLSTFIGVFITLIILGLLTRIKAGKNKPGQESINN